MLQEGGARKYCDNEVFERERSSMFYRRYKECNIGGEHFSLVFLLSGISELLV